MSFIVIFLLCFFHSVQNKASTAELEPKMALVKKDNMVEHDVKKVDDVLEQSCSRLSMEMSTKHVALSESGTLHGGMSRDQFSQAESVKGTETGDKLNNENVTQVQKIGSQAYQSCNENQEKCSHKKLSPVSPVKVSDMKHSLKGFSVDKQVSARNPQPSKNYKSEHASRVNAVPDELDVVPESPLSDASSDACSFDLYSSQKRDHGCLGESPSFEKESEPDSPMDIDTSKNSCQGSEADEETSPLCEDQEDIDMSKTPSKSSRFRRGDVQPESRKLPLASQQGEGAQFSFHLEQVDNPVIGDETHTEPSWISPVASSECRGTKHCGRKDSKITAHFMRVPRTEEKR